MKTIDLHLHSTISDGTDTPEELLQHVLDAEIDIFSITDHDAIKSAGYMGEHAKAAGSLFVPGVEFSCKDEAGKYHILGYGYDPASAAIRGLVEQGHEYRMRKVKGRLALLKEEFGVIFSEEDMAALLRMDNPGKPHIGNLMVRYGFAKTKDEAIEDYINKLHYPSEYLTPEEAIQGIREAGGIAVLAHPPFGSGSQHITGAEMEQRLKRLMAYGLQGIEAFYSGFDHALEEEMLALAATYDLYVTAGSDYHGRNKTVKLGETGLASREAWPEGLVRFFDDIKGSQR